MTEPFIKHPVVYGHPHDPDFETDSREHAIAYGVIRPLQDWLRQRLESSGRFTNPSHLDGQLKRDMDLLVEYETNKLTRKPTDFFGMDIPTPPHHGGPPAHALRNEDKTAAA